MAFAAEAGNTAEEKPKNTWEGGFGTGDLDGNGASQWFIDGILFRQRYVVGPRTQIAFDNLFSMVGPTPDALIAQNQSELVSAFNIRSGSRASGQMVLGNVRAALEFRPSEGVRLSVGQMRSPLGIEGTYDRFDWASYYYSPAYLRAQQNSWHYDLGALVDFDLGVFGKFEVGVFDGRTPAFPTRKAPAVAFRYRKAFGTAGGVLFEPVVSGWLGRWDGGAEDIGATAGFISRVGTVGLDSEVFFTRSQPAGPVRRELWSVLVAPSVDLGFVEAGLQGAYSEERTAGSRSEQGQAGVALAHTVGSDFRLRLTYLHTGLGAAIHGDDFRILLGGQF